MVPKQHTLEAEQAEEWLKIFAGLINEFLGTGITEKVCSPGTLLSAAQLLLAPGFGRDLGVCLILGWLHWIRYRHWTGSAADLDAAHRSFVNIYVKDPQILPEELREQFARERPGAEPPWEVWHAHARVLVEEFGRDRGERLLDHGIILYRMALDAVPANYPSRHAMNFNLGVALYERFKTLKERDDLDASIAALQSAAQTIPDGDPNRHFIWGALGDELTRRFDRRALSPTQTAPSPRIASVCR